MIHSAALPSTSSGQAGQVKTGFRNYIHTLILGYFYLLILHFFGLYLLIRRRAVLSYGVLMDRYVLRPRKGQALAGFTIHYHLYYTKNCLFFNENPTNKEKMSHRGHGEDREGRVK